MDWLASTQDAGTWKTNVPLGPGMDEALQMLGERFGLAASRPFRPKVDAVLFRDDVLVLVEAKDMKWRDGLGNLAVYRALVDRTPELAPFRGRRVEGWLLVPWIIPAGEAAAAELGLRVVVWEPAWIRQRIEDLNEYWTPAFRRAREDKKQLRRSLGVD